MIQNREKYCVKTTNPWVHATLNARTSIDGSNVPSGSMLHTWTLPNI